MYEPREDSYLIKNHIKNYIKKDSRVLDICAGTGILAQEALKHTPHVLAADINTEAVTFMHSRGIHAIQSNLFNNIKETFDLILCNPPYLPREEKEPRDSQLETTGGTKGHELTARFLTQAKKHLAPHGTILLVQSNLAPPITRIVQHKGYTIQRIDKKKFFMETLTLYKLTLKRPKSI